MFKSAIPRVERDDRGKHDNYRWGKLKKQYRE